MSTPPLSLTRRALLGLGTGAAGALALPWTAPVARAAGTGPRLLVLTALGGWDVSYALDPKPSSALVDGPELDEDPSDPDDREAVTTFGGLDVATNEVKRPAVSAYFARWADRSVIARGVWVGSISHDACRVRMLTGTTTASRPDLAAMAAAALGPDALLPYLDLGGSGFAGELSAITGRAGANGQLRRLLDRSVSGNPPGRGFRYPQYTPSSDDADAIAAWVSARDAAWRTRWRERPGAARMLGDHVEARARAARLADEGQELADALGRLRTRTVRGQLDLAIDVLDAGLSRTVTVDTGLDWDTHDDNAEQHGHLDTTFDALDHALTRLSSDGRLDDTLVLVLSEMTRTPRRNEAGGKDHWPVTSALLAGGPLAGGRVVGGTDASLDAVPIDLRTGQPDPRGTTLRYDHLVVGVLDALGVDGHPWFGDLEGLGGLVG